ncbi:sulfite exporter TauE/SafE family protein [Candidatus Microgenomates bacterium]|nr:sulfite exporter TauE/SafE family protein [Candidatus Microgenomates bacterium]
MVEVSIPIAFVAGLVSFFAPCVVPLIPAYVGYVTGVSLSELKKNGHKPYFKKILISSIFYILGFSIVFVLLGSITAGVGVVLRRNGQLIQRIGGIIIIILGLQFADVFKLPFLNYQKQFKIPAWIDKLGNLRSFFLGLVFAIVWTPCVGAILGSILALSISTQTALGGAVLLFVYSLGISIPFLIISLTLASAPKYISWIGKHIGIISKIAGILLAILGVLLLTDTYKYLNSWLFEVAFKFGFRVR